MWVGLIQSLESLIQSLSKDRGFQRFQDSNTELLLEVAACCPVESGFRTATLSGITVCQISDLPALTTVNQILEINLSLSLPTPSPSKYERP